MLQLRWTLCSYPPLTSFAPRAYGPRLYCCCCCESCFCLAGWIFCLFICLYLCVCLSVCLSVSLSLLVSVSVSVSVFVSVCLSVSVSGGCFVWFAFFSMSGYLLFAHVDLDRRARCGLLRTKCKSYFVKYFRKFSYFCNRINCHSYERVLTLTQKSIVIG